MNKTQISKFLRMGAYAHHISWAEAQYVHMEYGFIVTNTNRVFTAEEFWNAYANPFYMEGWCFSDPFRGMAERTLNDDTDELSIEQMMGMLRETLCKQVCGEPSPSEEDVRVRYSLWHGKNYMYRVVDEEGHDYVPGYVYSERAIGGYVRKLVELGVVKLSLIHI